MSPIRTFRYLPTLSRNYAVLIGHVLTSAIGLYRQPRNSFTARGYEVIPDFIDRQTGDSFVRFAESHLSGRSQIVPEKYYRQEEEDGGKCYIEYRCEITDINLGLVQFINVQKLDGRFSHLLAVVRKLLEERIGEELVAQSAVIQLDQADSSTKRRFHVDGLLPKYKAFIYLNDVRDSKDGPYTVIPGSHRHTFKKVVNLLYVRLPMLDWVREKLARADRFGDMPLFYKERQSTPILGEAGTMTLSNQLLVHQGGYNERPRWALILNFIPRRYWNGKPFDMHLDNLQVGGLEEKDKLSEAKLSI